MKFEYVDPADRMTPEEIRFHHSQGSPVYILAQLNGCSDNAIREILAGKEHKFKAPRKIKIVVDVDEGKFYSSIRDVERAEGYSQGSLNVWFLRHGPRVKYKGKEYHLYERTK